MKHLKPFSLLAISLMLVIIGIVMAIPQSAEAQCGSSASSCKTCHETQGEDPVNTEGAWHTQHAFGDFCEFCHAGNVQASDKAGAHEALAAPLEDVAASCQGCHPSDLTERAQKYASVLGIELNDGTDNGNGGGDSNTDGGSSGDSNTGEAVSAPVTGVAAPIGGEEIDFNLLYAESITPEPLIKNWGNIILLLLIIVVAGAFFVSAWSWEGWGKIAAGWINNNISPITSAVAEANIATAQDDAQAGIVPSSPELTALFERKPELKNLWPKLSEGNSVMLKDLSLILSDEKYGARMLHAVSRLDFKLASALKKLGETDRELLLALVKEI